MRVHVPVVPVPVRVEGVNSSFIRMNFFERIFDRQQRNTLSPPVQGLYHFNWYQGDQKSRLHLRIDEDGSGLLMVNANRVIHLNPTAVCMAYYSLNRTPTLKAIQQISDHLKVPENLITRDYAQYTQDLNNLLDDQVCPVCDLELETTLPFSSRPSAPYRMDLAITYRCNNACSHCYNARSRDFPELDTSTWKKILDRLWDLRIPHVVFTGGEPTIREDLPELIKHAENNGQITGLNTNGRKLSDPRYMEALVEAGLDHVQVTFESHVPEIHDLMVCHKGAFTETVEGIRNALNTRLFVMTNTTMLTHNKHTIPQTIEYLANLGVPTVGLNALIYSGRGKTVGTGLKETELHELLESAQKITFTNNQKLIWYTPTQYCNFDPVQAGFGIKGCTAALYNMCLEPDGGVLPCQSYYQPLGNILNDSWDTIWNHELSTSLRERNILPEKCSGCLIRNECGGGCPLIQDI